MTGDRLIKFFREFEESCRESGKDPGSIKVLFATKYLNPQELASFIGLYNQIRGEKVLIGENKVQDAQKKFDYLDNQVKGLPDKCRKVMIGNLQKNKINKALSLFDEIWGVDSIELARDLNARVSERLLPIFLEINVSGEVAKHGIVKSEANKAIAQVRKLLNLKLKGLMTMAPETTDRNLIRKVFRDLKDLASKHGLLASMGMSSDWKEAIQAGSDILRLGSAVFR